MFAACKLILHRRTELLETTLVHPFLLNLALLAVMAWPCCYVRHSIGPEIVV
jgi:hypothetical protein